jgi:hypothetical protein
MRIISSSSTTRIRFACVAGVLVATLHPPLEPARIRVGSV